MPTRGFSSYFQGQQQQMPPSMMPTTQVSQGGAGANYPTISYGHIGSPDWWNEYKKFLLGPGGANYSQGAKVGLERYLNMSGNQLPELLGVGTLSDILLKQGKTDPALFNQQLAGISRGTQQNQQAVGGQMANRGLGGSGLAAALQAAIGQQGVGQIAGARANENQLAEQRKRDDLQLLLQTFINPGIDRWAIQTGQYNAAANRSQQDQNAKNGFLQQIIGGIANYYTGGGYAAYKQQQQQQQQGG